jgi:hypothetical protein
MIKIGANSSATFAPRELAAVHKQFGKVAIDLVAADHVDSRGSRFNAAQLQHRISNAVREALLSSGISLEKYAEQHKESVPGMSYDRLVRVLRGETQMQLADLVTWSGQFAGVRALLLREETWPAVGMGDNGQ